MVYHRLSLLAHGNWALRPTVGTLGDVSFIETLWTSVEAVSCGSRCASARGRRFADVELVLSVLEPL